VNVGAVWQLLHCSQQSDFALLGEEIDLFVGQIVAHFCQQERESVLFGVKMGELLEQEIEIGPLDVIRFVAVEVHNLLEQEKASAIVHVGWKRQVDDQQVIVNEICEVQEILLDHFV